MPRVSIIRRESSIGLTFGSIFFIPASARFASRVHDFSPAFVLLASGFCLCRILTLGFLFLIGSGSLTLVFHVFVRFMGEYLDRPACSIGEHSGSQSFCLRARKIRAVTDTHQGLIRHDTPVISRILPGHSEYGTSEGTGKWTSPVRSRIFLHQSYSKK